jgi:hypothetical protein
MGLTNFSLWDLLPGIPIGYPFPKKPLQGGGTGVLGDNFAPQAAFNPSDTAQLGSPIRLYGDVNEGLYDFIPVFITWFDSRQGKKVKTQIPNALIAISGEKEIVETTLADVGTVFEEVFIKPYQITIIATLNDNGHNWPEDELITMQRMWRENQVCTLQSAITDIFLNQQVAGVWQDNPTNNFIMKKITLLDNQGSEHVEAIQIDGMSNVQFELEISG